MWVLMKITNTDLAWSTDWLDLNRKQVVTKNAMFKEETVKRLKIHLKCSAQEMKIISAADFSGRTEVQFVSFKNTCIPFWSSCLQPPFWSFATLLGCSDIYTHRLYQASQSTSILSSSFGKVQELCLPSILSNILSDVVWECSKWFKTITRVVIGTTQCIY